MERGATGRGSAQKREQTVRRGPPLLVLVFASGWCVLAIIIIRDVDGRWRLKQEQRSFGGISKAICSVNLMRRSVLRQVFFRSLQEIFVRSSVP